VVIVAGTGQKTRSGRNRVARAVEFRCIGSKDRSSLTGLHSGHFPCARSTRTTTLCVVTLALLWSAGFVPSTKMIRLLCAFLLVVAVAQAQDFSDKQRDFETGKWDFMIKREEVNVNSEVLCGVCSELMLYAKAYAHQSQPELEQTLKGLCKTLFAKHETEEVMCETVIKDEMPTIMKYIDTELSPTGICREMHLCS